MARKLCRPGDKCMDIMQHGAVPVGGGHLGGSDLGILNLSRGLRVMLKDLNVLAHFAWIALG
jgi:hypothetical protein